MRERSMSVPEQRLGSVMRRNAVLTIVDCSRLHWLSVIPAFGQRVGPAHELHLDQPKRLEKLVNSFDDSLTAH
jgi:hypothetical protein